MSEATVRRGELVVWCLPPETAAWARVRGYLARGPCPGDVEPVAKQVLAIPGDTVDVEMAAVAVNGSPVLRSVRLAHDSRGRALPIVPVGRYVMRQGQHWLWSPFAARSFDSRYFGPVPASGFVGVVRPVWTW